LIDFSLVRSRAFSGILIALYDSVGKTEIAMAPTDTLQAVIREYYRDMPPPRESVEILVRKQ